MPKLTISGACFHGFEFSVVGSFKTAHYRTLRISHDTDAQGTLEEK